MVQFVAASQKNMTQCLQLSYQISAYGWNYEFIPDVGCHTDLGKVKVTLGATNLHNRIIF